ncbi:hypothetical protein DFH06DRAFT_564698 [Mycena polygramma]|nr:hypothetical protein DFH06DRAFT_564698 [Mycena polygramma]
MLQDLHDWASQSDSGSSILWLHGPAGAGKSAIAQSFCEMLEAEGRLGASFFFKRGDAARGSGNKLFPTLAYQLARSRPDLKQAISAIVEDDPSIVDKDLSTQVLKLIIDPCGRRVRTRNLVIVIDGLDECEGEHIQRQILCSLGTVVREEPLPFRILVASRIEPHIQETFQGPLNDLHRPLNINQSFEEVQTYLVDEFRRIHREHWETMDAVDEPWPSSNVIEKLADTSSGYFVFTSMVIRFIDDRDFRPTERLDVIMGIRKADSKSPFAALDQLYIQILSAVPDSNHAQLLEVLAVIAAKFNLSSRHVEQLLGLNPGDVRLILRHLHPVLDVPQSTGERMTVHHASFLDFLEDSARAGVFHIGESQRTNLARHILKALSLEIDSSTDHVAWQLDQVEFEYVMSIQPTPDLVSRLRPLNTDFLVFPNVHHVIRKVLSWLRRCQPLPDDMIQLWEDYQAIVTSGVRSPSRMKIRSEGVTGELEMHRHFPQASAQLVKIMFNRVRQLLDSGDFSGIETSTADIEAENLADMDPSTIEDLASSMHYFGYWRGTAARTLIFNKEAVHVYRKLAATDPSINKDLASSLHNLGVDLHMTSQYEAAVCAEEEAVKLRRKLAETNPGIIMDLAHSLHNLGLELRNVGQYEAAVRADEEAVELRRKLTESDPSVTKDLARSLNNLAVDLRNLKQYEAAVCANEEAVEIRRTLGETDFALRDLASSLHNLGVDFRNARQYMAAKCADEEAVELRRKLAESDPSVTKDLAESLHHLGVDLRAIGHYKDAAQADEEASQLHRKLAENNPMALASSLFNLGLDLHAVGRYDSAVQAHRESVQLRRKLAETNPSITIDLASSLHNLGRDLRNAGQHEAAVRTDEEAVELRRKLAKIDPTITKDLARSLHNLGVDLRNTGRYEAAVHADKEAIDLRRTLGETNPSIKDLASSLHNLGLDLSAVGRHSEAAEVGEEATKLYRELAKSDPSVYKDLASSLHNLGVDLRNDGQFDSALRPDEEAVKLYHQLAETDPSVTKDLASCLHNLARDLRHVGRHKDAVGADKKAIELRRKLAETDPTVTEALAASLYNLAYSLRVVGRHEDALPADAEAVDIRRELAEMDPKVKSCLVNSMENLALNLNAVGRHQEAASTLEEALKEYSELDPAEQSGLHLASMLTTWATYLRAVGRQEYSAHIHEKGAEIFSNMSATDPESTADSLRVLANDFGTTGLYQDSLSAAEKSVELYCMLTLRNPSLELKDDLIKALGYCTKSLHALGREEDEALKDRQIAALKRGQIRHGPAGPSDGWILRR